MRLSVLDIFFWLVLGVIAGYTLSTIDFINLIPEIEAACLSASTAAGAGAG